MATAQSQLGKPDTTQARWGAVQRAADLAKLEHLDLYSLLLQLCQLLVGGGLVLEQLHMLMAQLALSRLQVCPLFCQLLQKAAMGWTGIAGRL